MNRVALIVGAVAAVAAVAAPSAVGKENVQATLLSSLPANAAAGDVVTVRWQLLTVEDGEKRPFGAGGVFVRLRSGAGGTPTIGFARGDGGTDGIYEARVTVPRGGVAGLDIGLRGFSSGPAGTSESDVLFPITNPPPRTALAPPRPGGAPVDDDQGSTASRAAIAVALIAAALAAYLLLRARRRRAQLRVFPPSTSRGRAG